MLDISGGFITFTARYYDQALGVEPVISLLIGLGNPGEAYHGTRHNFGFDLIDRLCVQYQAKCTRTTRALCEFQGHSRDHLIILARPLTFMNRSGLAVVDLLQHHTLEPDQMLVLADDISLPLGTIRLRANGSDGGHNGLASIIEFLDTDQFPRLRMGIGPVADNTDTADFVLERFGSDETEPVARMLEKASEAVTFALTHRFELAMSRYNRPPALPEQQ